MFSITYCFLNVLEFCVLSLLISRQIAQAFEPGLSTFSPARSYINASATAPEASSATDYCGGCEANVDAQLHYWYPSIFTATVATVFVTIDNINGTWKTTTSYVTNTETLSLPVGGYTAYNETVLYYFTNYPMTWPTSYLFVENTFSLSQYSHATVSGQTTCESLMTSYIATSADPDGFVIKHPTMYDIDDYVMVGPIPAELLTGFLSSCSGAVDGPAFSYVPVLSLTVTTPITRGSYPTPIVGSTTTDSGYALSSEKPIHGSTVTAAGPTSPTSTMARKTATSGFPTASSASTLSSSVMALASNLEPTKKPSSASTAEAVSPLLSIPSDRQSKPLTDSRALSSASPAAIISGISVLLVNDASALATGSSTMPLGTGHMVDVPATTTAMVMSITINTQSQFIVGSRTFVAGAPAITVSGIKMYLEPSEHALVIGSSTLSLGPSLAPTVIAITDAAPVASGFIIGSQTLMPGGPAIGISGVSVSLAPSNAALIIGSSTLILPSTVVPEVVTIAGETLTANSDSAYVFGTQTLIPGAPAITISGTPVSLAPDGSDIVIKSSTVAIGPTTTPLGLAGWIISAIGGQPSPIASKVIGTFTGGSSGRVATMLRGRLAGLMLAWGLLWLR